MSWTTSKNFHLRKNNLKAKLIRYDIFPVAKAMKEWHDYLTGFFATLNPSIYSFTGNNKFFSHKDFAFYLHKIKKVGVCACTRDYCDNDQEVIGKFMKNEYFFF